MSGGRRFRNDREIEASADAQEQVILDVAAGRMAREDLAAWVEAHTVSR